jgi:hypothetical protein
MKLHGTWEVESILRGIVGTLFRPVGLKKLPDITMHSALILVDRLQVMLFESKSCPFRSIDSIPI